MEDIIMKKLVVRSCNEFVVGKYRNFNDIKHLKDINEEQIMKAKGESKKFDVETWFGNIDEVKFTINKIEKDEYGRFKYTIEANKDVSEDVFPTPYQIVSHIDSIAIPISYSICRF